MANGGRKVALLTASLALAACAWQAPPPTSRDALPRLPAQWEAGALSPPGSPASAPMQPGSPPDEPTSPRGAQAGSLPAKGLPLDPDWWEAFGSDELDRFVRVARDSSFDLAAAWARIRQAEASARMAGAALLPAVDAGLAASRQGWPGDEGRGEGSLFGATLAARYELDFRGRNRAVLSATQAGQLASEFDRETVRLTVTAGVASAWLEAVALGERIGTGQRHVDSAERLLRLVEARSRAGVASPLELAQQRGLVAHQQGELAALRQQQRQSRRILSVLLGQATERVVVDDSLDRVQVPVIDSGLPIDLLVRRPDLARAEARLAAADGDVRAARAAMLPGITLAGGLATGGDRWRRLLERPVYTVAASLAAPIFDGGRLAAGHDLALARREELLADYRSAIVAAVGDVDLALEAIEGLDAQRVAQAEALVQAQRAIRIAESRYRAGAETLLSLLDAQRTLYTAQDAAAQLKNLRLQASVSLYKALGGGWHKAAAATDRPDGDG